MASKRIKGIIVEIGGNTAPLGKALKDADEQAKKTQAELRDINNALKQAPESAVLWRQKQELLTQAVQNSKDKLKALLDAQEEINRKYQAGEIGTDRYREFQREVESARAEVADFEGQLANIRETANNSAEAVGNLSDAAEEAGENAESSGEGFSVLKGAIADLAADGIRAAIDGFKELATEGDTALNSLQAKTGATAEQIEQYGEIMSNLYADNYGEDRNDIANAIAEVNQQLGEMSPEELEDITEKAFLLRDTFEYEVNESVRAANMLMTQFGITADEAYTLIAQGTQNGLNKNGDLMDVINEYGVHYKNLGYTAEEFFNSLTNGTAAGTFSVDKLGDAIKEFGIRTKDSAESTTEGFELIGLDADEMRVKFAEGGASAKQATQQTIDALFALDDKIVQNQAGVALFGTMWEDLSAEGVQALTNITGEANKAASTLEDIADVRYNDLGSQFTQLKRTISTNLLEPIAEKSLPKIKEGTDWVVKNIPKIQDNAKKLLPVVEGVAAGFVAWKALSGLSSGVTVVKDLFNTVKSGTAVMQALNTVMGANPYVAVAAGVVGLTGALIGLASAYEAPKTAAEKSLEVEKEYLEAVEKDTQAYQEKKDAALEAASADLAQVEQAEQLWQELDRLADASGKVSGKDKERADFILGQLNEALGTEYEMTGNQIAKYSELKESINDVISAKKANILLDSYESTYSEAVSKKRETESKRSQEKIALAETQKKIAEIQQLAADSGFGDISKVSDDKLGLVFDELGMSADEYRTLLATESTQMQNIKATENLLHTYYADIAYYEEASTAILNGNYEEAVDILDKKGEAFIKVSDLVEESAEKQKVILANQVREYRQTAESMVADYRNGVKGVTLAMVEEAEIQYNTAITEYNRVGNAVADGLISGIEGKKYKAQQTVSSVVDSMADTIYNKLPQMWEAGSSLLSSFADGISSVRSKVDNAVTNALSGALSAARGQLGINLPMLANGGDLHSGAAIVAEAGPELIEIINGGARVTPLTGSARNTAVSEYVGGHTTIVNNNIYAQVSSDYGVDRLSERLAQRQKVIEAGKGKR